MHPGASLPTGAPVLPPSACDPGVGGSGSGSVGVNATQPRMSSQLALTSATLPLSETTLSPLQLHRSRTSLSSSSSVIISEQAEGDESDEEQEEEEEEGNGSPGNQSARHQKEEQDSGADLSPGIALSRKQKKRRKQRAKRLATRTMSQPILSVSTHSHGPVSLDTSLTSISSLSPCESGNDRSDTEDIHLARAGSSSNTSTASGSPRLDRYVRTPTRASQHG